MLSIAKYFAVGLVNAFVSLLGILSIFFRVDSKTQR